MLGQILELIAFLISTFSIIYGVYHLTHKKTSNVFQLYVCGSGCYFLEEVWVIVNSLLGTGNSDALVSVRLFGLFGCLFFLLTANLISEEKYKKEYNISKKIFAHLMPIILIIVYLIYVYFILNSISLIKIIIGFVSMSPSLIGSFYCFKHILLSDNIKKNKTEMLTLLFYLANFAYPLFGLYLHSSAMNIYDVFIALLLLITLVVCNRKKVDNDE